MKKINTIVDRIKEQNNKLVYKYVGKKENLCLEVMSDASYYANKKSVAGIIVLLANKGKNNVSQSTALEESHSEEGVSEQ